MIFNGQFPGSNGWSFQGIAKRVAEGLKSGRMKADVVDPTLGNGCVTPTMDNINWVPTKPSTGPAFALSMIRWMMENNAHNTTFLSYPNQEAGVAGGYAAYTNASFLVIADENHPNYQMLMRPADAGLEEPPVPEGLDAATLAMMPENFVVIDQTTGQPALNTACQAGDIAFEGEVNGVKVRSALLYLKDSAYERTMDEYAEITGIPADTIARIAKEFTSHGTKAAMLGVGSTVMANGIDMAYSLRMMNALIGSHQMVGGCNATGGGFKSSADGERYKLATVADAPGISKKNATPISRNGKLFNETDEYKLRVAAGEKDPQPKLPWFELAPSADNQALVSIVNQYPYQAKILLSWMVNTLQATPGAMRDSLIDQLKDTSVVPLHIACDVIMGEHAQLADYFVPDTTPYESFGTPNEGGTWSGRGTTVRWRVKTPETLQLDDGRYASFETFCVDVAKSCDVPGFGENAIQAADGTLYPFNDAADYFLKAVANIAYGDTPVDDIAAEEIAMQALDNLPKEWKDAVGAAEWPKVLNVLSRGGRFMPIEEIEGEGGRSSYMVEFQSFVYSEPRVMSTNFYTGEQYSPVVHYTTQQFVDGTPYNEVYSEDEFPFMLSSHKARFRSTSMLANSPLMRDLCDHNYLELNLDDARDLGIKDGDNIRISGPSGEPMDGEAMVRSGIARGTFGIAHGYGHRAYGAQDIEVDGVVAKGNPAIGTGTIMQVMDDPTVKDAEYPVVDLEWASPGRNGGMYKIEKA